MGTGKTDPCCLNTVGIEHKFQKLSGPLGQREDTGAGSLLPLSQLHPPPHFEYFPCEASFGRRLAESRDAWLTDEDRISLVDRGLSAVNNS